MACRWTERNTERERETETQGSRKTKKRRNRETERQKPAREVEKQIEGLTVRLINRETGRLSD